jgi:hypothetical protein
MARHFKVLDILSDADRAEYEALLRQPSTTVDAAFEWLESRGYSISRGAVHNHKRSFEEVLQGVRRSSEMAASFAAVAKDAGAAGMNDALLARVQQMMMEWLFDQDENTQFEAKDWESLAKALNHAANAKQRIEDVRTKFDAEMKKLQAVQTEKKGGGITAADIADVRKAIFG